MNQTLKKELLAQLEQRLIPFEEMLLYKPFLLDQRPRFVDFDLYGMLGNFLYSGHYRLPPAHTQLKEWYSRMTDVKIKSVTERPLPTRPILSGHNRFDQETGSRLLREKKLHS